MKHEIFQELIHLSVYGELDDDQRVLLEEHVRTCSSCSTELAELQKLSGLVRESQRVEVTDRLLEEARRELRVALRIEQTKRFRLSDWIERFTFAPSPGLRLALGGLAVMVVGVSIGYLAFSPKGEMDGLHSLTTTGTVETQRIEPHISNLRFLQPPDEKGNVEVLFELASPVKLKGNITDDAIQKVLAQALLSEQNPGARIRTVSALGTQMETSLKPDNEVKMALVEALKSDPNDGVRKEALKVLKKLPFDKVVKDALLFLLSHESNPGLRVDVINYLDRSVISERTTDPDILNVLKERMENDKNNYVRIRAKNAYEEARQQ